MENLHVGEIRNCYSLCHNFLPSAKFVILYFDFSFYYLYFAKISDKNLNMQQKVTRQICRALRIELLTCQDSRWLAKSPARLNYINLYRHFSPIKPRVRVNIGLYTPMVGDHSKTTVSANDQGIGLVNNRTRAQARARLQYKQKL